MIPKIIIITLKLSGMHCNQRDSQLVTIQEIIIKTPKLPEMFYNQRDFLLVVIQDTMTEVRES
jgi:hypothetical protein